LTPVRDRARFWDDFNCMFLHQSTTDVRTLGTHICRYTQAFLSYIHFCAASCFGTVDWKVQWS
jgi:hypothetical protein